MPVKFVGSVWKYLATRITIDKNGCWVWLGAKSDGYGSMAWEGRGCATTIVHRVVWFWTHGSLPAPGLHLDHLCRNRACCNPDHLEPVTPLLNVQRGLGPPSRNNTHCKNGHPFSGGNAMMVNRGNGKKRRACRTCSAAACRRYQERQRARLAAP